MAKVMAKARGLSEADLRLWAAYSQTLKLMPGKTRLPVEPEAVPTVVVPPETPVVKASVKRRASAGSVHVDAPPPGLDRASWQKFRTGKARSGRILDLHGHTAARAHHATLQFIQNAHAEQIRVVEIITGKGEVLLRELPHWLNSPQLRPLILALAHPHAGNTGSVRILLRRLR
jgi:DNA-nicking Smr family endonuclease